MPMLAPTIAAILGFNFAERRSLTMPPSMANMASYDAMPIQPVNEQTDLIVMSYHERVRSSLADRLCYWRDFCSSLDQDADMSHENNSDACVIHHLLLEAVAFACDFDLDQTASLCVHLNVTSGLDTDEHMLFAKDCDRAMADMRVQGLSADDPKMRMLFMTYATVRETAHSMEEIEPDWCRRVRAFARDAIVSLLALTYDVCDEKRFRSDLFVLLTNKGDTSCVDHSCDLLLSYGKCICRIEHNKPPPPRRQKQRGSAAKRARRSAEAARASEQNGDLFQLGILRADAEPFQQVSYVSHFSISEVTEAVGIMENNYGNFGYYTAMCGWYHTFW